MWRNPMRERLWKRHVSPWTTVLITLTWCTSILAGGWNGRNNPKKMQEPGDAFEFQFDKLPTEKSLSNKPWTDTYWPTYKRGLADRWQGDLDPVQHEDESNEEFAVRKAKERYFTEKEILFMSEEERNKLSPAEKYDIINGDYDYTLTKSELARTREDAPKWEGVCHGWAAAAVHFAEPSTCKMGFGPRSFLLQQAKIPFASSDTKALLSLLQGNYNTDETTYFAGTRCHDDKTKKSDEEWHKTVDAQDINAGAFHVILANKIGLQDKSFVFDRTVDAEVWNQPIESFKTRVVKEQEPDLKLSAPGTKKELVVQSYVGYTIEIDAHVEPKNDGDRSEFVYEQPYDYILELDEAGKIIGGRWISDNHPDFVWMNNKAKFVGLFDKLKHVYDKSTRKFPFNLLDRI
jgi:hypothetical protein